MKNTPFEIAIVGPECSGKTTLARELGKEFNAPVIPEIARDYLSEIGKNYNLKDVNTIAQLQKSEALKFLEDKPETLIHDTEILTIKIWQEEKWQEPSALVMDLWEEQSFDLYLLCYPDLPWEDDGLRENPIDRERLFKIYEKQLKESNATFTTISGLGPTRLEEAMQAVVNLRS
ncbi:AAA family ATPase [Halocola ammonii]